MGCVMDAEQNSLTVAEVKQRWEALYGISDRVYPTREITEVAVRKEYYWLANTQHMWLPNTTRLGLAGELPLVAVVGWFL